MLSGQRMCIDSSSELFPEALSLIPSPPEKLYLLGNPAVLTEGLAVIGARKATPYGIACATRFSSLAARKGVIIISGGARGCDSAAHKAALAEGGSTLVFLGGGCDRLYPKVNESLFQQIIDKGGALVSEYEWAHPPMKYGFRARNRLIAGLARATLIVEAGLPSGTFSTADEALAANREVLVVPGAITSKTSRGANRLLYQGATPIVDEESFEDILFSLFGILKHQEFISDGKKETQLSGLQGIVHEMLCTETLRMDEIMEGLTHKVGTESCGDLMQAIVELEKEGYIARYPDGRYGVSKLVLSFS